MDKAALGAILKQHFGFDSFRPGQEAVLDHLLHSQDTLAVLPTGAGKTLIYQMYGLIQKRPIVIISPLLSLMQDQVSRLQYLGAKRSIAINSTLSWQQKNAVLQNLNYYQYVYISPEMLSQPDVIKTFQAINIGLVVIDEAHCISQWGPDFRPEYLNLKTILQQLGQPLTLMLTATASKATRQDIIEKLGLTGQVYLVVESIDRPNIYLSVRKSMDEDDKQTQLLHLVQRIRPPGIIYFLSRKLATQMALMLRQKTNLRIAAYHSDLATEDRFKIQHQFMNDQLDIICATSAFGMGIDKNDIRFVIHYHLPADVESYMQEIGRAGRDGKQSIAILLYRDGDEAIPANLALNNIPDADVIRAFYRRPEQLAKLADQDEQARLLTYYWQHGYEASQLIELFQTRYQNQRTALYHLLEYVNVDGCRRKRLLGYFDQTAPPHNDQCCDFHATQLPIDALGLSIPEASSQDQSELDWRIIIKKLFKNDDENA
ncbi:RecQ family ATP-dependent DNA helicase [Nicoliella lavandulae]|uniref:ATP-dependent DNA helicase RecQ n=1 Tax=Nicoliella lavandulae TaxID=3082954 RepID=A0ABU8SL85_9LACO